MDYEFQFEDMSEEMAGKGELIQLPPGSVVWIESDEDKRFYVIREGSVELSYEDYEGERLIIDIYHAGEFFGEIQMAGLETRNRMITSLTYCELICFTKPQFWKFWDKEKGFSKTIFEMLCKRLIRSGDEKAFCDRVFLRQRVLKIIAENVNEVGYFLYNKDVLRGLSGVSIRSLNRTLHDLAESGAILYEQGAIKLLVDSEI